MLALEDLRFACDDARKLLDATVRLIGDQDRQAMGFMQLYVALSAGAWSGGAAILWSGTFPKPVGAALIAFALVLSFGALACLRATWASDLALPGREPDFWTWAERADVSAELSYRNYLAAAAKMINDNRDLNITLSNWLRIAKICGVIATPAALGIALVVRGLGY